MSPITLQQYNIMDMRLATLLTHMGTTSFSLDESSEELHGDIGNLTSKSLLATAIAAASGTPAIPEAKKGFVPCQYLGYDIHDIDWSPNFLLPETLGSYPSLGGFKYERN